MQKIQNAKMLAPVPIPIALLDRLDRCVSLANEANPLQSISRATFVRYAIQRLVDSIEPQLERGRVPSVDAPLALPSGTDPTGMLSSDSATTKPPASTKRSRTRRGKPTRSWVKK